MKLVNVHEAKSTLSKLLELVKDGEDVIIGKAGKPVARLVPYDPAFEPRKPGAWKGKVRIAEDFDSLPADRARAFQGEQP